MLSCEFENVLDGCLRITFKLRISEKLLTLAMKICIGPEQRGLWSVFVKQNQRMTRHYYYNRISGKTLCCV